MGIQTHFDKFHDRIKLGREDDAYRKARKHDDSIKSDVKSAFKTAGYPIVNDFIQGSLVHRQPDNVRLERHAMWPFPGIASVIATGRRGFW